MILHIYPLLDTYSHTTDTNSAACSCDPTLSVLDENIFVIHNSFDGREIWEKIESGFNKDENNESTN